MLHHWCLMLKVVFFLMEIEQHSIAAQVSSIYWRFSCPLISFLRRTNVFFMRSRWAWLFLQTYILLSCFLRRCSLHAHLDLYERLDDHRTHVLETEDAVWFPSLLLPFLLVSLCFFDDECLWLNIPTWSLRLKKRWCSSFSLLPRDIV